MARRAKHDETWAQEPYIPAANPADRENQLIALAERQAAQQMQDGTASAQVLCHFLRLGTAKAKLELELLQREARLKEAKTGAIESSQNLEEIVNNALSAFKSYRSSDE